MKLAIAFVFLWAPLAAHHVGVKAGVPLTDIAETMPDSIPCHRHCRGCRTAVTYEALHALSDSLVGCLSTARDLLDPFQLKPLHTVPQITPVVLGHL